MWDERGRPVNPVSKRINRDIIRSHNEVMLVIGVAEPENGISESQAEMARKHHQYEDDTGHTLLRVARVVEAAGAWGITGARHRILVRNQAFTKDEQSDELLTRYSYTNATLTFRSINSSSMNEASGH